MRNYNQKKLSKWKILIFPSLSTSLMLISLCALGVLIPWIQLFLVKHRISFDVQMQKVQRSACHSTLWLVKNLNRKPISELCHTRDCHPKGRRLVIVRPAGVFVFYLRIIQEGDNHQGETFFWVQRITAISSNTFSPLTNYFLNILEG